MIRREDNLVKIQTSTASRRSEHTRMTLALVRHWVENFKMPPE